MHPLAERLSATYVADFSSADRDIKWLATEQEKSLWLSPSTVLLGRVDAEGLTSDGDPFFGEWKTLGSYRGRYIDDEKLKWRTDPQALTYGVLMGSSTRRFTVRWAIKPDDRAKTGLFSQPRTAFEWYTYTATEVAHWQGQLLSIADEIRAWQRRDAPWRTNFANCYRYGVKYACPFVSLCPAQKWAERIGEPRTPHLEIERRIIEQRRYPSAVPLKIEGQIELDKLPSDLVILDATRVGEYLECPENYRHRYEGDGYQETSEALEVGKDFHSLVSSHIHRLMESYQ